MAIPAAAGAPPEKNLVNPEGRFSLLATVEKWGVCIARRWEEVFWRLKDQDKANMFDCKE